MESSLMEYHLLERTMGLVKKKEIVMKRMILGGFLMTVASLAISIAGGGTEGGTGTVVLEGRISFEGTVPPARKIEITTDAEACHHAAGEVQDVVVSKEKGLADVVVEIRGIPEPEGGWKWNSPAGGYVIRQKDCRFHPPLLVVPDGERLLVYNDDAVAHNINTGEWNIMQKGGSGKPTEQTIKYRGRPLVRVNCNYHPWMEAWIYVAQSPFYAVTDEEGRFRIAGILPGTYDLAAYHPTLKKQGTKGVAFESGKTIRQDFTFEGR
jgi:hypothetical protein